MNPELEGIYNSIRALEESPQSPERERRLALLQWERRELEAWREFHRCRKAKLLFKAYFDTGRMVVAHPGGERREGAPHTSGVNDVQAVWNVRSEAENLAMWANP